MNSPNPLGPNADDSLVTVLRSYAERVTASGDDLFERAETERIAPLLYYVYRHHGWPEELADSIRRSFEKAYYGTAGRNVELMAALSDVATALAKEDIPCIAFKGADLAERLYPNVALRPMGDVDAYVVPDNAERAEAVLAKLGYRPWTPDMTPGLSRRIRHARLYVGGANDTVSIDLHWSLVGHADDVRAPERDWIDRHTRRSGHAWQCLSETAHLLYLAAHMKLQHYDEELPLLWLIDFHELASTGAIDWDELFADAARFGWTSALCAVAFDVRTRLGVSLPEPLERVAAPAPVALHEKGARNEPERVWNELRTLSWSGRLALARACVLPSPSYVRFRYATMRFVPSWAWPVGYLERWVTIGVKAATLVKHTLARRHAARPLLTPRETC